jgi:2-iminobutanoate/2-iminopropanoate deaminase
MINEGLFPLEERRRIDGAAVDAQCGPPLGPYSHGLSVRGGRTIYVAGQLALGSDGKVRYPGDAPAQFRGCMENIRTILETAGASLTDLVKVVNYVTKDVDLDTDYPQIAAIRRELITGEVYPVSSLVVVHALMQGALIEVEAVAVTAN